MLAANALYFNGLICPIVDARRENVYGGAYRNTNGALTTVIEDGHYALEELIQLLERHDEPVLFIGKDTVMHEQQLVEKLGSQCGDCTSSIQFTPCFFTDLYGFPAEQEPDIHAFVPEYRPLAEAEANWLKAQGKEQD